MSNDIYRSKEFLTIVKEHFDFTDSETRNVVLSLNEEDQGKAILSLTSKLYENIVDKVDDINFGDIPSTKGDATALPQYPKLKECIDIMSKLMDEFKQGKDAIDTVDFALKNLVLKKDIFIKAFRYDVEMPMILYNSIYLAIISATSLLISSCIEFIKQPTNDTFDIVVDKVGLTKTKDHMLFDNLKKFNDACARGQIDKGCEYVIQSKVKNFTGLELGLVAGTVAIAGIILNIVPIMRELVFFFFYSRTRVSDYFDTQADLLQMNAYNLEANDSFDKDKKKKIVMKQMSIVDMFRKLSNAIAIKSKESEIKATKDLVGSNKKMKADEVFDELPDSGASALF